MESNMGSHHNALLPNRLPLPPPPPAAFSMGAAGDVQLHVADDGDQAPARPSSSPPAQQTSTLRRWRWWLVVALNVFFLLAGQTAAVLLGRLYYDEGGSSKWMATLVQSAGFPILLIPLLLYPAAARSAEPPAARPSPVKVAAIYLGLGLIIAGDNLMYSYGLLYLPVSTYSLICATQLAFNAVFAYFLNGQKFNALILNSVVLLTFSAALLGVQSEDSGGAPRDKYPLGFVLTLGASAAYALILSLMQLTFQRVLRRETFAVVLRMQIWTSAVAASASAVGLAASGEAGRLRGEMEGYAKGRASYVLTLVWTAVGWQVASVGVVGLVFVVSSLFSNVVSTLGLPLVPVFAVVFFHDKMQGVKIIAMLIALWGFASYIYQHYLDDKKAKMARKSSSSSSAAAAAAAK